MKKANIIFGLILGITSLFLAPNSIKADAPACNITMSGVSLVPGSKPEVHPASMDNGYSYFPFQACITDTSMQNSLTSCQNSGSKVTLHARFSQGLFGWKYLDLTQNNYCFNTTIKVKDDQSFADNIFDLEIDKASGNCADGTLLCARVEAKPIRSGPIDDPDCEEAITDFINCESLEIGPDPNNIIAGKPLTFDFYIDPLLDNFSRCGATNQYEDFDYYIFPPSGSTTNGKLNIGNNSFSYTPELMTLFGDPYKVSFWASIPNGDDIKCETTFSVGDKDNPGSVDDPSSGTSISEFLVCNQIPIDKTEAKADCETCYDAGGVWTSVGCINRTSTEDMVATFMKVGLSIAGGVALLMILASAFMFSTSEGEPKRTSEAKEILTHALIGLLFIIFSVTLLQFIGVSIFRLPEFGL